MKVMLKSWGGGEVGVVVGEGSGGVDGVGEGEVEGVGDGDDDEGDGEGDVVVCTGVVGWDGQEGVQVVQEPFTRKLRQSAVEPSGQGVVASGQDGVVAVGRGGGVVTTDKDVGTSTSSVARAGAGDASG